MVDQPCPQPHLAQEFWLTLALTAVPGILGGLTYGVSTFLNEIKSKPPDWPPNGNLSKWTFFLAQALSGMGGSIAALLVILWANRFPERPDQFFESKALLTLLGTGFVAGYIANRLLPAIAGILYDQLTRLSKKTDQAGKTAEAAKEEANQASVRAAAAEKRATQAERLGSAQVWVFDYLDRLAEDKKEKEEKGDRKGEEELLQLRRPTTDSFIAQLEDLKKSFPANRVLNILLARLYAEAAEDNRKAITSLAEFIQAKAAAGQGRDAETADAFWNTANYYNQDLEKTHDPLLKAGTIEALRQSLARVPSYYVDLLNDEDFKEVKDSEEGIVFMAEMKQAYEQWKAQQHPK
jgi:outer membrane murein-binding lipoprotein Lpp